MADLMSGDEPMVQVIINIPEEAREDIEQCARDCDCSWEEFAWTLLCMGREQFEDMINGISYLKIQEGGDINEQEKGNDFA